ncbi:MAG: hypothetical protein KJ666_00640 [Bacteroidetes bacterium]|nr:hypothetical protein [Bacteroidota bacterium]MBU2584849.1 hypothetical protein [Bacteroidota bacterium]
MSKRKSLHNPLIFDTSALYNFGHRGQLNDLLKILSERFTLIISTEVFYETRSEPNRSFYDEIIKTYFKIEVLDLPNKYLEMFKDISARLDKGETEVLGLSLQLKGTAIIDERAARKLADKYELNCNGTLGLLKYFYDEKIIDDKRAVNIIDKIKGKGFHLPEFNTDSFNDFIKKIGG